MNTRHVAAQALLHVVAMAMMTVGGTVLAALPFAGPVSRQLPLVPPLHAALLAAFGLALLLDAHLRVRAARLAGAAIALIAGWSLLRHGWSSSVQGPFPGPPQSVHGGVATLGIVLLGSALALRRAARPTRVLGLALNGVVMAIAVLGLVGPCLPAWADLRLGARHQAAAVEVLLALGAIGGAVHTVLRPHRAQAIPLRRLLVGLLGVLACTAGWYVLTVQAVESGRQRSDALLAQLQTGLAAAADERLALVNRVGERWRAAGRLPDPAVWHDEMDAYLRDFASLEMMALLDADRRAVMARAADPRAPAWLRNHLGTPHGRDWLAALDRATSARMSAALDDSGGVPRNLLAVPIGLPGTEGWTLVAVQNLALLLEQELTGLGGGLWFQVREGPHLLYDSRPGNSQATAGTGTALVVHEDLVWTVSAFESGTPLRTGGIATAVLLCGLALVALLATSQQLAALARRNAVHVTVQRDTMAMIARTDNLRATLDAICAMVEEREPGVVCTVHTASDDGRHLTFAAGPSLPPPVRAQVASVRVAEGSGSCGTAAERRAPVLTQDIARDPAWQGYRERTLEAGLHACYSQPMLSLEGSVLGTIALYFPSTGRPSAEQRRLLASTAEFAAVAIARARDRALLRANEQRYRSLFAYNPDVVYSMDLDGRYTGINPAGEALLGVAEAALVGRHLSELMPPEEAARVARHLALAAAGDAQHFALRARDARGEPIDLDVTHMPIAIDGDVVGVFGIAKDVTERNRMSRALGEREQFFTLSPEMFAMLDAEGRFVQINPAFSRFTGYPADLLIGHAFRDLLHEDDRTAGLDVASRLRRGESIADFELRARHRGGDVMWLRLSAVLGGDSLIYIAARDVTEERRIADDLARKERSYHQLLNDNRDALLVVGHAGDVKFANPAARSLLGDSLAAIQASLPPLALGPGAGTGVFEWTFTGAGGEQVEAEVIAAETDWDGETTRLLSLRDVRRRKESEKQLRLLQRALQASHNSVLIADARAPGRPLTYVNQAFERMTGYPAVEVIGRSPGFLFEDGEEGGEVEAIRRRLLGNQEAHGVVRSHRRDGTVFWADVYIAPVPDSRGTVTHFIGILRDVTEQKKTEAWLAHTANHDQLTGLPNRRMLEKHLAEACEDARATGWDVAAVFFDLDGFKPINDSMGHAVGDLILIEVAKRMRAQVRGDDIVARLSGDEFVMVLSGLPVEQVERVAQRTIQAIAQPYELECGVQHITASAGIAYGSGVVDDPMQLVRQADLAMYRAKNEGRNNVQWHTAEMSLRVTERVRMRNELQGAIEAGGLQLAYQPQFDAGCDRVVGIEALARWRHPERGDVPAGDFIPVAEETGQIVALGAWALETACAFNQSQRAQGVAELSVAVNISPMQFQRRHFVRDLRAMLARTGLPPRFLELEITEGVLVQNAEAAIHILSELKQLGVRVSIDDFGTGFSSLSYLKSLPIDKVKIDRSFVRDVTEDANDAAIARAIISMAHNLDLKVVAEGVETDEQLAFLRRNGCDEFQGYLLSRPLGPDELDGFLRAHG